MPPQKQPRAEPTKQIAAPAAKHDDPAPTPQASPSAEPAPPPEQPQPLMERPHPASPKLSVSVTSEPTFSPQTPLAAMRSADGPDDGMSARNLWLPPTAFGFSQLTNFRLSEQLTGDAGSEHSLAITATTHFIQPITPINTGNNTVSLKPSFVTALSLDGKWKHLTGSLSVWNDTGLLATFVDASVGYKFKMGPLDFGAKVFVSDNITLRQINGIVTFETGQKIAGLNIGWRVATNLVDAPYPQSSGSNVEFGVQGEWGETQHFIYNAALQQPFRDGDRNRQFAVNVGFKF